MTSAAFIVAPGKVTPFGMIGSGTTFYNSDPLNAVWISNQPNVAPGIGIQISAYGSVTTNKTDNIYMTPDTGVTTSVLIQQSDGLEQLSNPVALGAAIAVQILSGTQKTQVVSGSLNANVAGTVNAYGYNVWNTLVATSGFFIQPGNGSINIISQQNVANLQSVMINWNNANANGYPTAISGIRLEWYAAGGQILAAEEFLGWQAGFTTFATSVKGQYLSVYLFIDYTIYPNGYGYGATVSVLGSTIILPEYYYSEPGSGVAYVVSTNNWGTFQAPGAATYSGGLNNFAVQDTTGSNKTLYLLLPTYNRLVNGTFTYQGFTSSNANLQFSIQAAAKGLPQGNWPLLFGKYNSGISSATQYQYFTAVAPRSPILVTLAGFYCYSSVTLAYERF